jgi:energy-coupling factor transporter ATP-binding protein EcfA2
MKLKSVKIRKLFGTLNPIINFDSGIKLIYGKNGTGKTTILRILNAICSGSLYELKSIKFQNITCTFDGGVELFIQKANDNKVPATRKDQFDKKNLLLSLKKSGKEVNSDFIKHQDDVSVNIPIDMIEREIPELDRIGRREWRNKNTGEFLSLSEIVDAYGQQLPWLAPSYQKSWYKEFIDKFKVKYIQTQRLITYNSYDSSKYRMREARTGYENTVTRYSLGEQ